MKKTIGIVIGAVVVAALAFGAGFYVKGFTDSAARDRARGAFGSLSDAERQQLRDMTAEQRQQFFRERGIEMPADGRFGPGGAAGGRPGGTRLLDGTVVSLSGDQLTLKLADGGSTTVYVGTDTVKATAQGATAKLAAGAKVLVVAEREAEGVTAAKVVVVR